MRPRLSAIRALLADDGALFAEIDDTMLAPLHTILDASFGRENRVSTVTVVRSASTGHKAINLGPVNVSDYLLVYAKDRRRWRANAQWRKRESYDRAYGLFIPNRASPVEDWRFEPLRSRGRACLSLRLREDRGTRGPRWGRRASSAPSSASRGSRTRAASSASPNRASKP